MTSDELPNHLRELGIDPREIHDITSPTTTRATDPVPAEDARQETASPVGLAAALPMAVMSAILRDFAGPYYPDRIGVFCDHCGVVEADDYVVHEGMTRAQRLQVARDHLVAAKGWRSDDGGDFCPSCKPTN
ncbi:hypothetical protein ABT160_02535 [Streptomyces sp. NPDC001941]|uniref:hypothetical protein n=1 Tax=Streptomyces sp. NPDC001941 TaxID=3154659 RepID=UPI003329B0E3